MRRGGAGVKQRPYLCVDCGKRYVTSSNLSRHRQTHRSRDLARQCGVCGKAYVSMPALAMHVLTHQLQHACEVCGKLFSRTWLLRIHMRLHTGERPHLCEHCGRSYADLSNLRAHLQNHARANGPSCPSCGRTFVLAAYLDKHLKTGCGEADDIDHRFQEPCVVYVDDDSDSQIVHEEYSRGVSLE